MLFSKLVAGETFFLYLVVSYTAVSAALVLEEGIAQYLVHYINKAMVPAETRYSDIEKLALALVILLKKLMLYFQAYPVDVPTDYLMSKFSRSLRLQAG